MPDEVDAHLEQLYRMIDMQPPEPRWGTVQHIVELRFQMEAAEFEDTPLYMTIRALVCTAIERGVHPRLLLATVSMDIESVLPE